MTASGIVVGIEQSPHSDQIADRPQPVGQIPGDRAAGALAGNHGVDEVIRRAVAVQFSCSYLLHAAGSARVAVFAMPPLGGTTLVPIPRAGARAQGLLQGLGVSETLVRGLGQTS